jgi:AcrR family transcriptional regulator
MASSPVGVVPVRRPVPGPRGGGLYVSAQQRRRLLEATLAVVAEQGYGRMTARRVSGRAGVSNKTFYDLFSDREDCFLAAFDEAVGTLGGVVASAYASEREWVAGIRAGLGALLALLDREPALRTLAFVEALGAGPRVLARRTEILGVLQDAVDRGCDGVRAGRELPALTAEGVVGAAFGVIYARLIEKPSKPLIGLLAPLMAMIVLPYRGHGASTRELSRPAPDPTAALVPRGRLGALASASAQNGDFRLTVRTHLVLTAVAELAAQGSNPSNREVSDVAGVKDQGQISKLLTRLEGLGLLHNTGGHIKGMPNAWELTPMGVQAQHITSAPTNEGPG